jgi:hypothetical protein
MATKTNIIEIDQAQIAAPHFPREVDWWRTFLPCWFSDRTAIQRFTDTGVWEPNMSRVTVDPESHTVRIEAQGTRHARTIYDYLTDRSVLGQFVPEDAITWSGA